MLEWQVENLTAPLEWQDVGATMSTLTRLSFGAMDLGAIQSVANDSPLLIVVLIMFMMLVYSFFFNLLVSPLELNDIYVVLHGLFHCVFKGFSNDF